ncbi:FecR family protein [Coprobacter tertius]|uniref:FecR family protein n=1 Tax=Coprobacter tertius TaxID=2944915 RepID=A0ABT1MDY4_9BACT|nr:FecR family protein [Coprobacter tertius]MCP9610843.1 FecR family protein [Coprobacter tertius]
MKNSLLAKYLFNETSTAEREKVEKWLAEKQENKNILEQLRQNIDLASRYYRYGAFDPSAAYRKMKKQLPVRPHKFNRTFLRYAAIFLFILMGGFCYYSFSGKIFSQNITITCISDKEQVLLPDNSVIVLARDAQLSYPKNFTGRTRKVTLYGKAFFSVTKNKSKPFIINTPFIDIKVLGTQFQVIATDTINEVYVTSGKVKVTSVNHNKNTLLTSNMVTRYLPKSGVFDTRTIETLNNRLSWETGIFHFEGTPLYKAIKEINAHYHSDISIKPADRGKELTATFENLSLQEITEIIENTFDIQLIKTE